MGHLFMLPALLQVLFARLVAGGCVCPQIFAWVWAAWTKWRRGLLVWIYIYIYIQIWIYIRQYAHTCVYVYIYICIQVEPDRNLEWRWWQNMTCSVFFLKTRAKVWATCVVGMVDTGFGERGKDLPVEVPRLASVCPPFFGKPFFQPHYMWFRT